MSSSSSSPSAADGAHAIIKEGILWKGKAKWKTTSWNQRWIILTRGALYYYRKKTNLSYAGVLELSLYDIKEHPDVKTGDRQDVFLLQQRKGGSKQVLLSAQSPQEREEWIAIIKQHQQDKDPLLTFKNPHAAPNKSASYKMQANVASSALGRKLIKEIVDDDSWKALDALTRFIRAIKGEEVANKFKKDLLSIGSKLALLHKHNMLSENALPEMNKAVRVLAQAVVDYYQMPSIYDADTLITFFDGLRKATEPQFEGKVTPKSLQKLKDIFNLACDHTLLDDFFTQGKWGELSELVGIIRTHMSTR